MESLRMGEYRPLDMKMLEKHWPVCLFFWLFGMPFLLVLPDVNLRLAGLILGAFLSVLSVLDFRYGLLYDKLLLPLAILGAGLDFLGVQSLTFADSIVASGAAAGCFWLLRFVSAGGLGWGDIKFVAVLGIWLGYPGTVVAVALAVCLGALWALGLLLNGYGTGTCLPFGPCLSLGAYVSFISGDVLWQSYWEMLL